MKKKQQTIAVLNASGIVDYLYGFVSGLAAQNGLRVDVIDSNRSRAIFNSFPNVRHFDLIGDPRPTAPLWKKMLRFPRYYLGLMAYTVFSDAKVFHVQWVSKFGVFERTFMLLFYKVFGKRIVFTAHNLDPYGRGSGSGRLGKWSLRFLYSHVDHIIVHAQCLKHDLMNGYKVPESRISVIPIGINNFVQTTGLSRNEARKRLGIAPSRKLLLNVGNLQEYKGVDILIDSFNALCKKDDSYYAIVAGSAHSEPAFATAVKQTITKRKLQDRIMLRAEFVPDEELETLLMAADCMVLPYRAIYHSAVLFLAYRFGLPVVATAVGGLQEDVIDGRTGFLCPPNDAKALADTITKFFESDLYANQDHTREDISKYTSEKYSWGKIGVKTLAAYYSLLGKRGNA